VFAALFGHGARSRNARKSSEVFIHADEAEEISQHHGVKPQQKSS
jgi:hypothetical protein